jgi:hypothetical protein
MVKGCSTVITVKKSSRTGKEAKVDKAVTKPLLSTLSPVGVLHGSILSN